MFGFLVRGMFPLIYLILSMSAAAPTSEYPKCRFSPQYSQYDVLKDSSAFAWDMLYWEGHFHQNDVGYNTANGMSYNGTLLNPITGLNNVTRKHPFSAASKEVLLHPGVGQ